jgi:ribosomal protein L33
MVIEQCAICLEPINPESSLLNTTTPCGHAFHAQCLLQHIYWPIVTPASMPPAPAPPTLPIPENGLGGRTSRSRTMQTTHPRNGRPRLSLSKTCPVCRRPILQLEGPSGPRAADVQIDVLSWPPSQHRQGGQASTGDNADVNDVPSIWCVLAAKVLIAVSLTSVIMYFSS